VNNESIEQKNNQVTLRSVLSDEDWMMSSSSGTTVCWSEDTEAFHFSSALIKILKS
jgi:hypothetical protein